MTSSRDRSRRYLTLPALSDELAPEPVAVTEVEDDQAPENFIQFGDLRDPTGGVAIQPTTATVGAALVDLEPAQRSYAATRGSADPSQVRMQPQPRAPRQLDRHHQRHHDERRHHRVRGAVHTQGHQRRCGDNTRTSASRRGQASNTSSASRDGPGKPDPDDGDHHQHLLVSGGRP